MNTEHTNQSRQAANAAFEQWWQRHGLEDPMDDEDRYYITASSWARRGYLAAMQAQPTAMMALAEEVRETCWQVGSGDATIRELDLAAIVDRYVAKPPAQQQAEPVAPAVKESLTAEPQAELATLCASCARADVNCPIYPQQTASCVEHRPATKQQAEPVAYPPYSVFSNSDGDSWEEHPASDCFVHGKKLGEEFELLAGWQAERVTFRVTKVPDDESDDYEVEEVNPAPVATENSASVLVDALEKLARLGAGDRYGNSDGNRIAQQALATYRDYAVQPPAVAVPDEVAKDAARYRWLRQDESEFSSMAPAELDAAIDKAIAAAPQGVVPVPDQHNEPATPQEKYFTVVYRGIAAGNEARELSSHPKMVAMSWSHALRDRDAALADAQKGGA